MDIAGNNRYELLFLDDESAAPAKKFESASSKKKQPSSSVSVKKSAIVLRKSSLEKENKSCALNKNEVFHKNADLETKANNGARSTAINRNHGRESESRKVDFKAQNDGTRGQKDVKRNFRDGVEFGNEQREPRQLRDRDSRNPPRNRDTVFRVGKREFDRQSGSDKTGVKAVDKRDGAGAHNWGSVKQEIEDINKSTTDTDVTDKDESSNEQSPVQEKEEVMEFTLDEWRALRGERIKPQYNIRKPNEGEDTSQWKKMVVLNKKKEGDSEEEYEYDPSMYPQRVGRLQRIVDIQFKFNDGRRGGGGFGRARGRGPRAGGDAKSPHTEEDKKPRQQRSFGERQQKRPNSNAFKVDDERQFPTLS